MGWKDLHPFQPAIATDLAALTPLHDFVLVRPDPPADLIINPGVHMTKDYRWRQDRPRGNRTGRVVAIGKGDRVFAMVCKCEGTPINAQGGSAMVPVTEFVCRLETARSWKCDKCGSALIHVHGADGRAPMHVQPGDVVVFPRVPANEIEINGEEFVFLHEEQHILAVIEEIAA